MKFHSQTLAVPLARVFKMSIRTDITKSPSGVVCEASCFFFTVLLSRAIVRAEFLDKSSKTIDILSVFFELKWTLAVLLLEI